jgi:hypothetical protein
MDESDLRKCPLVPLCRVAALFADSGVVAITSFISPYKSSRDASLQNTPQFGSSVLPIRETLSSLANQKPLCTSIFS